MCSNKYYTAATWGLLHIWCQTTFGCLVLPLLFIQESEIDYPFPPPSKENQKSAHPPYLHIINVIDWYMQIKWNTETVIYKMFVLHDEVWKSQQRKIHNNTKMNKYSLFPIHVSQKLKIYVGVLLDAKGVTSSWSSSEHIFIFQTLNTETENGSCGI